MFFHKKYFSSFKNIWGPGSPGPLDLMDTTPLNILRTMHRKFALFLTFNDCYESLTPQKMFCFSEQ